MEKLVGVMGWPLDHSLSPLMHNRAFLDVGLSDWRYVPLLVARERIKDAVLGLRALGFRGANVTVPHKEAVMPYLDGVSDAASAIGAVNTIVVEHDGLLMGHNTDALGFMTDLCEHNVVVNSLRVLVVGAGGAARAVVYGLTTHGCTNITVVNRTKSKADELAHAFTGVLAASLDDIDLGYDLIINTTSIGMTSAIEDAIHPSLKFHPGQIVYDVVYNPPATALLMHASRAGARCINGVGMLVHQGALAFELWTGARAPVAIMRGAVENAILVK